MKTEKTEELMREAGREAVRETAGKVIGRRSLQELNLVDNFLFGTMVSHPKVGEEFSRTLLRILLQKEFKGLKISSERVLYGKDTDAHGVRLDLYLEEEEAQGPVERAAVYDVEPDKNRKDGKVLPFRIRFYHSKIDNGCLAAGDGYEKLKRVFILMILTYDPFGLDRMLYTIRNSCVEEPGMDYDDGATTLLFFTRGTRGIPSAKIQSFLRYMEHSVIENVTDETLVGIHKMVETVKKDAEVTTAYMRWMELEEELVEKAVGQGIELGMEQGIELGMEQGIELGMAQGIEQGMAQGIEQGMAQGIEQGMAQGMEQGRLLFLIEVVQHNLKQGVSIEEMAVRLGKPEEELRRICQAISEAGPDDTAENLADRILNAKRQN